MLLLCIWYILRKKYLLVGVRSQRCDHGLQTFRMTDSLHFTWIIYSNNRLETKISETLFLWQNDLHKISILNWGKLAESDWEFATLEVSTSSQTNFAARDIIFLINLKGFGNKPTVILTYVLMLVNLDNMYKKHDKNICAVSVHMSCLFTRLQQNSLSSSTA